MCSYLPPSLIAVLAVREHGHRHDDLLVVASTKWGTDDAAADLNDDGIVSQCDVDLLLARWGRRPNPTARGDEGAARREMGRRRTLEIVVTLGRD